MSLLQITVNNVRNLKTVEIQPGKKINLVFGTNGSGKTSLLEAIHFLSQAKSFRTTNIRNVVSHGQKDLTVFGKIGETGERGVTIGLEKSSENLRIKVSGKTISKKSELAQVFPVQVINQDSHGIFELGPRFRRHFIDWGVFHVEHNYLEAWKDYYRILKQRNAALRQTAESRIITAWNSQLLESGKKVTHLRIGYLAELEPVFKEIVFQLLQWRELSFEYQPGWDKTKKFSEALSQTLDKDLRFKSTQSGPHRADILIRIGKQLAQNCVSRGQQKLLIIALKIALVLLIKQKTGHKTTMLIDDLAAELDKENRDKMLGIIEEIGIQAFITTTEPRLFDLARLPEFKMFHVEHGKIYEVHNI
jgi:DNA replication and repair protein RecF